MTVFAKAGQIAGYLVPLFLGAWALVLLLFLLTLPAQVVYGDIETNNAMAAHHFFHGGRPSSGLMERGRYHPIYPIVLSSAFLLERFGVRAVFHAGLIVNWLLWIAGLVTVWYGYADNSRHAALVILLIALWSASWSYTTVLYSETLFILWLTVTWAWHKNLVPGGVWWKLAGLGVWSGLGYAVRPAGAIVWLALLLVITAHTRSLRRALFVFLGGCAGMAAALALVSYARGSGLHLTTYAFPREMRGCDPMRYAGRATLALLRTLQSGICESYGLILLAPLCLLRRSARRVSWEAVLWCGCWLVASLCASLTVACYPVYQPAFVVTRYTTPFVLMGIIAIVPAVQKLGCGLGWHIAIVITVAVAAWCMPSHEARLIDNVSVAWWQCAAQPWNTILIVLVAALLSFFVTHPRGERAGALCLCLVVIAYLNGVALWNSSRKNGQRIECLRRALPTHIVPGMMYRPVLGTRNTLNVFDYAVLQLWYPAVGILPPQPWSVLFSRSSTVRQCRLKPAVQPACTNKCSACAMQ